MEERAHHRIARLMGILMAEKEWNSIHVKDALPELVADAFIVCQQEGICIRDLIDDARCICADETEDESIYNQW